MSTRRYDASRRQAAAARTKAQIVEAARELFLARGYAATTMSDVAAAAGVAPATANAAFGGKVGLLKRLIDITIAGDGADLSVAQRDAAQAIVTETDARQQCRMMGLLVADIHQRLAPVVDVLQQASGVDDEARRLAAAWSRRRREDMVGFVEAFAADALRPGVDVERGTDVVWALTEHRLFIGLVVERGWSPDDYADWLGEQLAAALLR